MKSALKWALLAYCVFMIAACCSLPRFNRAQQTITTYEEHYKPLQLERYVEEDIPDKAQLQAAYADIKRAMRQEKCLKDAGLLADAFLVSALSEFRLDLYGKADTSADYALTEYLDMEQRQVPFDQRKKWMARILPLQIAIEQMGKSLKQIEDEAPDFSDALEYYEENIYNRDPDKPAKLQEWSDELKALKPQLRAYEALQNGALFSRLIALKIRSDAQSFLWGADADDNWSSDQIDTFTEEERDLLETEKALLLEELDNTLSSEDAAKWRPWWEERI
ncbi:MAG TPA: hypothetical protein VJ933_02600 [Phaeodactylibacter sp.]|nr:hypothetical protein [Phaeodactylibacter sp.]